MINQLPSFLTQETLKILENIDEKKLVSLNEFSKRKECIQLLIRYGWLKQKNSDVYLSNKGKEKLLLFRVIIEQDSMNTLYEAFKTQIYERFQLIVRQNLTDNFFEQIENCELEELDSIFICSPWVSLTDEQHAILLNLKKEGVGIFIIIRPIEGQKTNTLRTHNFLLQNKINLYYYKTKPALHTKLYLIKKSNYRNIAIFGSENLTNAKNEELGMIIQDRDFYEALEDYFLELQGNSKKSGLN